MNPDREPDEPDIRPQRYEGTASVEDEFEVWRALNLSDDRPLEAPTLNEEREERARGRWAS